MDSNKIKLIFIVSLSLFAALYLGVSAATEQMQTVAWTLGGLLLIGLLILGNRVWALVPVFSVLAGQISFLPGYPSPWYAVTPVAAMMLLLRFFMRTKMFSYRFCWMDVLMILQIVVLMQAYMRNPVTLSIFGGDSTTMIGGRPYIDYSVAIFAYFMLACVKTNTQTLKNVILWMAIVMILDSGLKAISVFSGGLARVVGMVYSNVDYAANFAGAGYEADVATTRFTSFSSLSAALGLILFSFYRPISCLNPLHIGRFFLTMLTGIIALFSGFRSELIKLFCYFVAGSLARRRTGDMLVAGAVALVASCILIATVDIQKLPHAIQRSISFLPVEVDAQIRESAEGSSEWRFEMWRLVLTSDRYISNKVLGDGFGYTAAEHQAQVAEESGFSRGGYRGDSIDAFIAKGSYHGWHVEAIRFTGYVGLAVGIAILFGFAIAGWKLVKRHANDSFFPYAVFVAMPFIIAPFFYLFVFGSYKGSFILYIASASLLRMCYMQSSAVELSEEEPSTVKSNTDRIGSHSMVRALGNTSNG
jgi:hypothetical protein